MEGKKNSDYYPLASTVPDQNKTLINIGTNKNIKLHVQIKTWNNEGKGSGNIEVEEESRPPAVPII